MKGVRPIARADCHRGVDGVRDWQRPVGRVTAVGIKPQVKATALPPMGSCRSGQRQDGIPRSSGGQLIRGLLKPQNEKEKESTSGGKSHRLMSPTQSVPRVCGSLLVGGVELERPIWNRSRVGDP